jgi:hypothetical protein
MRKPIKKLSERKFLIFTIFFTLFIGLISLISFKGIPDFKVNNSDKIGHFIAYFLLCFSWLYTFKKEVTIQSHQFKIVILLIAYGIIIEVLQGTITNYRQADFFDVVANTFGVVTAFIFFKNRNN